SRTVCLIVLSAMALSAQSVRDLAPLQNWSAPLFWQPSRAESETAARANTFVNTVGKPIAEAQTPVNSLVFVGMTPCRAVDTRGNSGFTGAFGPPSLAGGVARNFPTPSSTTCSIPAIAQAYSFNVTVVPPGPLGFLTVWPGPVSNPQPVAA